MKIKRTLLYRACATVLTIVAAFLTLQQSVSAATLVHRYNFTDDGTGTNVVDLIGGTAWYGWLPAGGDFATFPGMLWMDKLDGQYAQLPAGILSNYTSVTIDAWCSLTNSEWGFIWAFGNTDPNTTYGGQAIWCHVAVARLTITDTMPSWGGEQNAFFANQSGQVGVHITCVIDPPNNTMTVFTNGVLAGQRVGPTHPLSSVSNVWSYIGNSVFSGDGTIDLVIDEFRIWNGTLNGVQVAACQVEGPDNPSAATNDIGTITNLIVSAPYPQLVQGGHEMVSIIGLATLFTNQLGVAQPITIDNYLCSYKSADTNILRVDSTGLLTGIRPGTTSVTARYGSVSNAIAITVFPEPVVLAHRYSFNETSGTNVADSIGGPAWTGTLPNGGTFTNGQLSMLGASQQYVNIPTNIFSGMTNVTFDVWTTFPTNLPWNTWFFGFGDIISGAGAWYFFVQPQSGSFCMGGGNPGWQFDGERASAAMDWSGQTLHITCVASTGGGYLALYTNGVLAATYNSLTYPITSIHDNFSYINQSLYSSDPHVDLTINELRIYSGALSPAQVVLNDELGPDVLAAPSAPILSVAIVGGNVVVSWPTNSSGFTLASKGSLTGGSWNPVGTAPVISGANYQVTLPPTNTAQFFRLSK